MRAPHRPDPFDDGPPPFTATFKARQMAAMVQRDESDGVWRCRYCRIPVQQVDQPRTGHVLPHPERDHVVPLDLGGSSELSNLVVSCQGCNVRKGNQLLAEMPSGWSAWREQGRTEVARGSE